MATDMLAAMAEMPTGMPEGPTEDEVVEDETKDEELAQMVDDFKAASGAAAATILSDLLHEMGFRRTQ